MTLNTPSPTFPAIALPQFENERLPPVMPVALRHPDVPALPDVTAATRAALDESRQLTQLAAGSRVAITCGSRGIRSKPAVVKAAVAWLKDRGLDPFIVPAMGSHGGAVASSQVTLLAELGFTEEAMGCPIRASMEVVRLGRRARASGSISTATPSRPMRCWWWAGSSRTPPSTGRWKAGLPR